MDLMPRSDRLVKKDWGSKKDGDCCMQLRQVFADISATIGQSSLVSTPEGLSERESGNREIRIKP